MKDIEKYNQIMREKIKGMTGIKNDEVVSKFKGIRLVCEDEREEFLEYLKDESDNINICLNMLRNLCVIALILNLIISKTFVIDSTGCVLALIIRDNSCRRD